MKERILDYKYSQRWDKLTKKELIAQKMKLISKINILPIESQSVKDSMMKILSELEYYIKRRFQN